MRGSNGYHQSSSSVDSIVFIFANLCKCPVSKRISLGSFFKPEQMEGLKKNKQCEEKRERRECESEGERDGNVLCLLGYMIRHICSKWHYVGGKSLRIRCSTLV